MYLKQKTNLNSNSNYVHSRIINLFNDFRFSENDAHKIVEIINVHLNKEE